MIMITMKRILKISCLILSLLDPFKDLRKHFLASNGTSRSSNFTTNWTSWKRKVSPLQASPERSADLLGIARLLKKADDDDNMWFPIYIDCWLMKAIRN